MTLQWSRQSQAIMLIGGIYFVGRYGNAPGIVYLRVANFGCGSGT